MKLGEQGATGTKVPRDETGGDPLAQTAEGVVEQGWLESALRCCPLLAEELNAPVSDMQLSAEPGTPAAPLDTVSVTS